MEKIEKAIYKIPLVDVYKKCRIKGDVKSVKIENDNLVVEAETSKEIGVGGRKKVEEKD
jgi:hypothetical protein